MKKAVLWILSAVLVIGLDIGAKLFLIGEPVDGSTVFCDVIEGDNQVSIFVTTSASAMAFRDNARLHQEGNELHITLYKVLVSPLNPSGQWSYYLETMDLTKIYLGGKLIWSAD